MTRGVSDREARIGGCVAEQGEGDFVFPKELLSLEPSEEVVQRPCSEGIGLHYCQLIVANLEDVAEFLGEEEAEDGGSVSGNLTSWDNEKKEKEVPRGSIRTYQSRSCQRRPYQEDLVRHIEDDDRAARDPCPVALEWPETLSQRHVVYVRGAVPICLNTVAPSGQRRKGKQREGTCLRKRGATHAIFAGAEVRCRAGTKTGRTNIARRNLLATWGQIQYIMFLPRLTVHLSHGKARI